MHAGKISEIGHGASACLSGGIIKFLAYSEQQDWDNYWEFRP